MAIGQESKILPHLRRTLLLRDGAGLTDGQLLDEYINRREEAAFAALVRRHGPMVWGVCRRILRSHHDAEDAFQATFLVLVRKAASILPRQMVANWLYGVACQTALKARAIAVRRRTREKQVTEMPEPEANEQTLWHDLRPVLDQELSRLPDKYRAAIVLCDLEGKTYREAARQLGCPEGTLAARLSRGRNLLGKRLAQRGIALPGGTLAAVLAQNAAAASVPPAVMSVTIKAASLYAAGQAATGVISLSVAALTEGVLKTMLLSKLRIATAMLLALSLTCFGVERLSHRVTAVEQQEPARSTKLKKGGEIVGTLRTLEGTWLVIWHEEEGKAAPLDRFKGESDHCLVIEGGLWLEKNRGEIVRKKSTIVLDPTHHPKHLDLVAVNDAGWRNRCIYELAGDNILIVCQSFPGEERPTDFKTSPNSKRYLTIYQKQAAEPRLYRFEVPLHRLDVTPLYRVEMPLHKLDVMPLYRLEVPLHRLDVEPLYRLEVPLVRVPHDFVEPKRPQKDTVLMELKELRGRWIAIAGEDRGKRIPGEEVTLKNVRFEFSDDKLLIRSGRSGDAGMKVLIVIDPAKMPKTIDLSFVRPDGVTSEAKGIYELEGDALKICYGKVRPTGFKTRSDPEERLYVLKREKQ